ncbi:MAG TPA: hypothetical protein VKX16_00470 [Chloroflexota bacterium]|nr:hypothetical protein [Chloroflexota bacterium]
MKTDSSGNFAGHTIKIPKNAKPGAYSIAAIGQKSGATATFTAT